jgi:hypothetical protein
MRTRHPHLALVLSALALFAAACSSGFSRDDAIAALTEDAAMSETQAICVVDGIEDVDGVGVGNLESDAELSDEQRAALIAVIADCEQLNAQREANEADQSADASTAGTADIEATDDPPGTDPELDALWAECGQGDDASCRELFWAAPEDSPYEAYGQSCGGREGECFLTSGDGGSGDGDFADLSPTDPPPGDDAELDALWIGCSDGSASACDQLFFTSPVGSDYERFGLSCGARENTSCSDLLGDDSGGSDLNDFADLSPTDPPPGNDAELDALWIGCSDGSASACDQLFFTSPVGSDYERFGLSCGARENTSCSDLLGSDGDAAESDGPALTDFSDLSPSDPPPGEDAELDALWVACGERSADACNDLFFTSPSGSVYERFGFSCGARAIGLCETVLG